MAATKKEIDVLDNKLYQEELKEVQEDKQKRKGLPLFIWYFIVLVLLLILAFVFKSAILLLIIVWIFFCSVIVFIMWQFVDCLRMMFKEGEPTGKYALWLGIIILAPFIGAMFYWFLKK